MTTHGAAVRQAQVQARLAEDGNNVTTRVARHNPFDTCTRWCGSPPHYYNTEAELDRAVTTVARIATE